MGGWVVHEPNPDTYVRIHTSPYVHQHHVRHAHQRAVHRPGRVHALLLPAREIHALLANLGLVPRLEQRQVPSQRARLDGALCVWC